MTALFHFPKVYKILPILWRFEGYSNLQHPMPQKKIQTTSPERGRKIMSNKIDKARKDHHGKATNIDASSFATPLAKKQAGGPAAQTPYYEETLRRGDYEKADRTPKPVVVQPPCG